MDNHTKVAFSLSDLQFYCFICNMKQYLKYFLTFIVFVLGTVITNADTEFQLTQFTTADGLPNNTVRHIIQDSRGHIWICTSNGLCRYDGKEFHNYHPLREGKGIGLIDQRVQKVFEDNGLLWVATAKGVSCYDLDKSQFVDYSRKGLKVPVFPKDNIHKFTDKQGRTWRVTNDDGLYIDNNKGQTEHFTTTSKNNPLPTNALKCIFQDNTGVIWIGTDNLGISQIKVVQNDGVSHILDGENIRMLMHLDDKRIMVSNRSGETWTYDSSLTTLLSTNTRDKSTYCVLMDNDSNIWEGTKGAGVYVNGVHRDDSPYKDIYAFLKDRKGDVWIGTFGAGLFHKDKHYLSEDNGNNRIRSLIQDDNGNIWAGTSNGVYVLNTKQSNSMAHLCVENGKLYSNEIRAMYKDSKGNIYICEAGEGFAVINAERFCKDNNLEPRHFTQEDSLVNTMVQSFVEDNDGFVWIATEFGISKLNASTGTIKNYFFSKNMLNNVYSENCGIRLRDGRIAFGTNNGIVIITPSVYNEGEKTTDITADDVTVNGQGKTGIVYVVSKWWKSPWAIASYLAILVIAFFVRRKVRRDSKRFHKTIKDLSTKKDELITEKEQLITEKKQLSAEKDELNAEKEEIKALYTTEVTIRREADISAQDEEFIRKVEAIAANEMGRASFTADDFAEQMGMGRTVFFNRMKKTTGYSPKEYLKLRRIKKAAELISTTVMPIGEVGFEVGIEDPLYFSRVFKQEYGMTPTEWRKNSGTKDISPSI